jgi:TPP-dependent pyruvate/acetoin dehydrogenase alpha subunit
MNVLAVNDAAKRAVAFVRNQSKPFLLEMQTYRFRAHSMYDPDLYRTKEEVDRWKQRCPIVGFETFLLKESAAGTGDFNSIERQVEKEVLDAIAFAEAGELEPPSELTKDVYTQI